MLMIQLTVAALLPVAADPVPAAMVLATKGEVTLTRHDGTSRPARVMDILYVDDKLKADGEARIVILGDGHKEKLTGEVTLTENGGSPDDRVTREPGALSAAHLAGLKKLARGGRGGVVVPRGTREEATTRSPMEDETLFVTEPNFTWEDTEPPAGFVFTLERDVDGKFEKVWEKETSLDAKLEFPESEKPLQRGEKYRWRVDGKFPGDNRETYVTLTFRIATDDELTQAKELRALVRSDDPEDWLLAATTLDSMGLYTPAREVFAKLAAKFPNEPAYLMALAAYHERSGDIRQAKAVIEQAEKLQRKPD